MCDSTYCMAFHKLLGNVSTTSCISSNSAFRVNFIIFFEKLEQLLGLKMALLPYFCGLLDQRFFCIQNRKKIHTRQTGVSQVNKFYKIKINIDA